MFKIGFILACLAIVAGCASPTSSNSTTESITGLAQWAKSTVSSSNHNDLESVATDAAGNIYVVGFIRGTSSFGFGNGVSVLGATAGENATLIKYNSAGGAQWASTVVSGPNESNFASVAIDASGNIYAVGRIYGNSNTAYDFGNSVTVKGLSSDNNLVIVKFNPSGVAQWATTEVAAPAGSELLGVKTDGSGNIYAVGTIAGTSEFNFGNSVKTTGTGSNTSPLIIKYNSSGVAQWAKTTTTSSSESSFRGIAMDGSGNLLTAGYLSGTGTYSFGNSVTATAESTQNNMVVVKYNSSGLAQWAKTTVSGSEGSWLNGVATDSSGNVYAVGYKKSSVTVNFGNNVSAAGLSATNNALIVKYNSAGQTQWARTTSMSINGCYFNSVAIDGSGNLFVAGSLFRDTYGFGNGVTVTAAGVGSDYSMTVKYNSSGVAQWANSVTGSSSNYLNALTTDSSGNVVAAGNIMGTGSFDYGNGATTKGASGGDNALIVKYNP